MSEHGPDWIITTPSAMTPENVAHLQASWTTASVVVLPPGAEIRPAFPTGEVVYSEPIRSDAIGPVLAFLLGLATGALAALSGCAALILVTA